MVMLVVCWFIGMIIELGGKVILWVIGVMLMLCSIRWFLNGVLV